MRTAPTRFLTRRRRASVAVETALCLTLVILPLSMGILQYGIIMSTSSQVELISREAARFAAVHCLEPTFDDADTQATPPSLRYYLKNNVVSKRTSILWSDIDGPVVTGVDVTDGYISVSPGKTSRVAGQTVSVTICYPMRRKVFTGKITPNITTIDNDYKATSSFTIE